MATPMRMEDEMHGWEWDEKGHFWFERTTGEQLTPQQVWDKLADATARIEELEKERDELVLRLDAVSKWSVRAALLLQDELQCILRGEDATRSNGG